MKTTQTPSIAFPVFIGMIFLIGMLSGVKHNTSRPQLDSLPKNQNVQSCAALHPDDWAAYNQCTNY